MNETHALSAVALATLAVAQPMARRRLELSIAKHPSLTGHARMAQRVAAWLPGYVYGLDRFFNSDNAPAGAVSRRRAALHRLSTQFAERYARPLARSLAGDDHAGRAKLVGPAVHRRPARGAGAVRS